MNFLINFLTLKHIYNHNSYFSNSKNNLFLTFYKIRFLNFFTNFFFSLKTSNLLLKNSFINNFLSSSIQIQNNFTQKIFETTIFQKESNIIIQDTNFIGCSTINAGGAFSIIDDECSLVVNHCIFFKCLSRGFTNCYDRNDISGGSFLFYGLTSSISYSCFDTSISNGIGISFYSQVLIDNLNIFNHSIIINSNTEKGKFSFCLEGGLTYCIGINSSFNQGKFATGGGFGFKPLAYSGHLRFSQFCNNGGISVFLFQVASMEDRGNKFCNFLNNTLNENHTGVLCISSELRIKRFYFIGNNALPVYTTSKMYLVSCITDWTTLGVKNMDNGCEINFKNYEIAKLIFMKVC